MVFIGPVLLLLFVSFFVFPYLFFIFPSVRSSFLEAFHGEGHDVMIIAIRARGAQPQEGRAQHKKKESRRWFYGIRP